MASLKASQKFRVGYRNNISVRYNPWLHILAVYAIGLVFIIGCLQSISDIHINSWAWLTIPVMIILVNLMEYSLHRWLGHIKRPFATLFYQRHSGDHHTFFVEENLPIEQVKDFRVVFFPVYLIIALLLFIIAPTAILLDQIGLTDVALLFSITTMSGYLTYETLHGIYHLPNDYRIKQLPGLKWLCLHHQLHHRTSLAKQYNFNLIFPLFDWLFGTLFEDNRYKK